MPINNFPTLLAEALSGKEEALLQWVEHESLDDFDEDEINQALKEIDRLSSSDSPQKSHAIQLRAFMHKQGLGDEINLNEAIRLYEQAIALGNTAAMNSRALMHQHGTGGPRDEKQAIILFRKAIDLGNTAAMNNLAYLLTSAHYKDYTQAIKLYEQAIQLGNTQAMVGRAKMHEMGLGDRKNAKEAISLYEQAIKLGNTQAMVNRAVMHKKGLGGPKSVEEAISLYKQAIKLGNIYAQPKLNRLLEKQTNERLRQYNEEYKKAQLEKHPKEQLVQSRDEDTNKNSSGDLNKNSSEDLNKNPSEDLNKNSSGDLNKNSSEDLNKNSSEDLNKNSYHGFNEHSIQDLTKANEMIKKLSILTKQYRDTLAPQKKQIIAIVDTLILKLNPDTKKNEIDRVKDFYQFLDSPIDTSSAKENIAPSSKNIDIIKKDTSIPALNFLMGIALIAATIATGILPGILVAAIVYKATGKQPLQLFESRGEKFEKQVSVGTATFGPLFNHKKETQTNEENQTSEEKPDNLSPKGK